MGIPQAIRYELYKRADGRCECIKQNCDHSGKRCSRGLSLGLWDAHPRTVGGPETLNNLIAMCPTCHETHGRGQGILNNRRAAMVAGLAKLRYSQYHREPLSKALGGGLLEDRDQNVSKFLQALK